MKTFTFNEIKDEMDYFGEEAENRFYKWGDTPIQADKRKKKMALKLIIFMSAIAILILILLNLLS